MFSHTIRGMEKAGKSTAVSPIGSAQHASSALRGWLAPRQPPRLPLPERIEESPVNRAFPGQPVERPPPLSSSSIHRAA